MKEKTDQRANVEEQLKRSETGALADVWRRQQEKEVKWMRSLLEGMHNDTNYKAAKAQVGATLGLRAEELGKCPRPRARARSLSLSPPVSLCLSRPRSFSMLPVGLSVHRSVSIRGPHRLCVSAVCLCLLLSALCSLLSALCSLDLLI